MTKSAEELEWARAKRANKQSRLPLLAALLVGAVLAVLPVIGMIFYMDKAEAAKQARLDRGETVIELRSRSGPIGIIIGGIVLAAVFGTGGFLVTFKVLGGKLPEEYSRAFGIGR